MLKQPCTQIMQEHPALRDLCWKRKGRKHRAGVYQIVRYFSFSLLRLAVVNFPHCIPSTVVRDISINVIRSQRNYLVDSRELRDCPTGDFLPTTSSYRPILNETHNL